MYVHTVLQKWQDCAGWHRQISRYVRLLSGIQKKQPWADLCWKRSSASFHMWSCLQLGRHHLLLLLHPQLFRFLASYDAQSSILDAPEPPGAEPSASGKKYGVVLLHGTSHHIRAVAQWVGLVTCMTYMPKKRAICLRQCQAFLPRVCGIRNGAGLATSTQRRKTRQMGLYPSIAKGKKGLSLKYPPLAGEACEEQSLDGADGPCQGIYN